MAGVSLVFWGMQKRDNRNPASFETKREIPELGFYDRLEDTYFRFPESYNICEYREEVLIVLEARGVAVLSETDPKIQIHVSSPCTRPFNSPVFLKSFCEVGLFEEEDGEVFYKMINGMGFFPREWSIKKILIRNTEVTMENQPILKDYIFSCYE